MALKQSHLENLAKIFSEQSREWDTIKYCSMNYQFDQLSYTDQVKVFAWAEMRGYRFAKPQMEVA